MKEARIFNWIALIWTVLGTVYLITDPATDIWTLIYITILIVAQVTALKRLK